MRKRGYLLGHITTVVVCISLAMLGPVYAQQESDTEFEAEAATGAEIAAARETLNRTLSPGGSRDEEVRYLQERERAAFTAGAGKIRLEVLRRLVELYKGTPEVYRYWGYLWRAEWTAGNQQKAFEIGQQLAASDIPNLRTRAYIAATLAWDYGETGQMSQAWSAINRAERLREEYAQGEDRRHLDYINEVIDMNRGRLLMVEGRYTEAETALRKAREAVMRSIEQTRNSVEVEGYISLHRMHLGNRDFISSVQVRLLSTVGRHVEAEAVARQALQEAVAGGTNIGHWYQRIAIVKLAQRRYTEALALANQAIDIFAKAGFGGSATVVLWARESRLQALIGLERWSDANAEHAAMMAATAGDAVGRRLVSSQLLEALLSAMTGGAAHAEESVQRVVRFRAQIYGERHPFTIEAKAVQALVQQAAEHSGAALRTYRQVFSVLFAEDTTHVDTATRGLRGFYLPLALQHFLKLVTTLAASGQLTPELIGEAFVVADRLRDSVVQQAIVDSAVRTLVEGNPDLAALVRKEQDARVSVRTVYNNIIQRNGEIQDAQRELAKLREAKADASEKLAQIKGIQNELQALRKKVGAFDQEQRDLRGQLAKQFPAYHRLVNPVPLRPSDIANRLEPDEALLSVYSTATHTFVWAIKPGVEPFMHIAPVGAETLARDVARLRATLELEGRTAPASYDFATAHRLYSLLLEPAAKVWSGQRVLTVIASGALGQIPFALLTKNPTGGYENAAWLVNDIAIVHAASASAWAAVRDTAGKLVPGKPFIGFGDPQFSATAERPAPKSVRSLRTSAGDQPPSDYSTIPPLPETREEIIAIAKALGANVEESTFFGKSATRSQVMKLNLADHRVIAFATHGMKPGDMANLSQPALAMAATSDPDESPSTLHDILRLKVAAELIVLSACNTASDDGTSEEAISGLGRGFFFAGARSLLVTHWAVESQSAQALVTSFFKRAAAGQERTSRAERLRQAQLEMIAGRMDARYRHPSFWAPFALVGDGRAN